MESTEMWCWRRMEKICSTDRVINEKVLHRVKKERNILLTLKKAGLYGFVCLVPAFYETFLKERYKKWADEEEDASSC
jgi:hypothetical protein